MSEEQAEPPTDGDTSPDDIWGDSAFPDPFSSDSFTDEIANIDQSDWDLDPDQLWGDAGGLNTDGDSTGAEFAG